MSDDPSDIHFGARRATKKKPDTSGRNTTDSIPSSTTAELLSSNQMKPDAQSYTTAKPVVPRPSDSSGNNTSSTSSGSQNKQSWWTQLKFKGGEGNK